MLVAKGTICIIGAGGALAKTRLLPALFSFIVEHPENRFCILLVDKYEINQRELAQSLRRILPESIIQKIPWETVFFLHVDMANAGQVSDFEKQFFAAEKSCSVPTSGLRFFYCATSPRFFSLIMQQLSASQVISTLRSQKGIIRCAFEKPFGFDVHSADALQKCLLSFLSEEEIVRVDHYMSKAMIRTILMLRSANRLLSSVWSGEHISSIEIGLLEKETLEHRASFYDSVGTVRDVVQNHLLNVLALLSIPLPESAPSLTMFDAMAQQLAVCSIKKAVRAQYHGYRDLEGVGQQSLTETYIALECALENETWSGVPFYIKAGKAMAYDATYIRVNFKPNQCRYAHCSLASNQLQLLLAPRAELRLRLYARQHIYDDQLLPIELDSGNQLCCLPFYEAYKTIFMAIVMNDPYISLPFPVVRQAWSVVQPLLDDQLPLQFYDAAGPVPDYDQLMKV